MARDDDDDSWLQVDAAELEKLLEERYGTRLRPQQDIVSGLDSFLAGTSAVDGVEFPPKDDQAPVRPSRGIKKRDKEKPTEDTGDVPKVRWATSYTMCSIKLFC